MSETLSKRSKRDQECYNPVHSFDFAAASYPSLGREAVLILLRDTLFSEETK